LVVPVGAVVVGEEVGPPFPPPLEEQNRPHGGV
jgi:hypothetical protein